MASFLASGVGVPRSKSAITHAGEKAPMSSDSSGTAQATASDIAAGSKSRSAESMTDSSSVDGDPGAGQAIRPAFPDLAAAAGGLQDDLEAFREAKPAGSNSGDASASSAAPARTGALWIHTHLEAAAAQLCRERVSREDGHQAVCCGCGGGGELVLCDGCYQSWHWRCDPRSQESKPGVGRWLCITCDLSARVRTAIQDLVVQRRRAAEQLAEGLLAMGVRGVPGSLHESKSAESVVGQPSSGRRVGRGGKEHSPPLGGGGLGVSSVASGKPRLALGPGVSSSGADPVCVGTLQGTSKAAVPHEMRAEAVRRRGATGCYAAAWVSKRPMGLPATVEEGVAENGAPSDSDGAPKRSRRKKRRTQHPDGTVAAQVAVDSIGCSADEETGSAESSGNTKRGHAAVSDESLSSIRAVSTAKATPPSMLPVPMTHKEVFLRVLLELLDSRDARGYCCAAVVAFRPTRRPRQAPLHKLSPPQMWLSEIAESALAASMQGPLQCSSQQLLDVALPTLSHGAHLKPAQDDAGKNEAACTPSEEPAQNEAATRGGASLAPALPGSTGSSAVHAKSSAEGPVPREQLPAKRARSQACVTSGSADALCLTFGTLSGLHQACNLLRESLRWWRKHYVEYSTPYRHSGILLGALDAALSELLYLREFEKYQQESIVGGVGQALRAKATGDTGSAADAASAPSGAAISSAVAGFLVRNRSLRKVSYGDKVLSSQDVLDAGTRRIPRQPDPSHSWNATAVAALAAGLALKQIRSRLRLCMPYEEFLTKTAIEAIWKPGQGDAMRPATRLSARSKGTAVQREAATASRPDQIPDRSTTMDDSSEDDESWLESRRLKSSKTLSETGAGSKMAQSSSGGSARAARPTLRRQQYRRSKRGPRDGESSGSASSRGSDSRQVGVTGRSGDESNESHNPSSGSDSDGQPDVRHDRGSRSLYARSHDPSSLGYVSSLPVLRGLRYLGPNPHVAERSVSLLSPGVSDSSVAPSSKRGGHGTSQAQPRSARSTTHSELPVDLGLRSSPADLVGSIAAMLPRGAHSFGGRSSSEADIKSSAAAAYHQAAASGVPSLASEEALTALRTRVKHRIAANKEREHHGLTHGYQQCGVSERAARFSSVRLHTASSVTSIAESPCKADSRSEEAVMGRVLSLCQACYPAVPSTGALERAWQAVSLRFGTEHLEATAGWAVAPSELQRLESETKQLYADIAATRAEVQEALQPTLSSTGICTFDARNDALALAAMDRLVRVGQAEAGLESSDPVFSQAEADKFPSAAMDGDLGATSVVPVVDIQALQDAMDASWHGGDLPADSTAAPSCTAITGSEQRGGKAQGAFSGEAARAFLDRLVSQRLMQVLRGSPKQLLSQQQLTLLSGSRCIAKDPHLGCLVMSGAPTTCVSCIRGQVHLCPHREAVTVLAPNGSIAESKAVAGLLLQQQAIRICRRVHNRQQRLQALWAEQLQYSKESVGTASSSSASRAEPSAGDHSVHELLGEGVPSWAWLGTSRTGRELLQHEMLSFAAESVGGAFVLGQMETGVVVDCIGGMSSVQQLLAASNALLKGGGHISTSIQSCVARILLRSPYVAMLLGPRGIRIVLRSEVHEGGGAASGAGSSVAAAPVGSAVESIRKLRVGQVGPSSKPKSTYAMALGRDLRELLWGDSDGPRLTQMQRAAAHCRLVHGISHPACSFLDAVLVAPDDSAAVFRRAQIAAWDDKTLDDLLHFASPSEEDVFLSLIEARHAATRKYLAAMSKYCSKAMAPVGKVHGGARSTSAENAAREGFSGLGVATLDFPSIDDYTGGIDDMESDILAAACQCMRKELLDSLQPPEGASMRTAGAKNAIRVSQLQAKVPELAVKALEAFLGNAAAQSTQHQCTSYVPAQSSMADTKAAGGMLHPRLEDAISTRLPEYGPVVLDFVSEIAPEEFWKFTPVELLARRARWNLHHLRVGPSRIDGLGLFATREIQKNDVIGEYQGQLVSNAQAAKRQVLYETQGVADYMFRVGPDAVIDATTIGSTARYLNHSCEPNCYAINTLFAQGGDLGSEDVVGYAGNRLVDAPGGASFEPAPPHDPEAASEMRPPALITSLDGIEELQPVRTQVQLSIAAKQGQGLADGSVDTSRTPHDPAAPGGAATARDTYGTAEKKSSSAGASSSVQESAGSSDTSPVSSSNSRPKRGRLFFYAARDLAVGEELTYDYSFPTDEATVPCKCGALSCRGTINTHIPGTSLRGVLEQAIRRPRGMKGR